MSNEDTSNKAAVNASPFNEYEERQRRYEALQFAVVVRGPMGDAIKVVEAAEKFHVFLAGEDVAKTEDVIEAPTEPGFYKYSGGRAVLIFLLRSDGQWYTWFDSGEAHACRWEYIEQALGVWDLVKI